MSERYSKLFALSENLYSAGAPVVIAAGALQKDNQTGKVFAQLKIRNIQDKAIKAITVKITPFDTAGRPLGGTIDYQYLDLSAARDVDFGQKTPVMLKEAITRSFAVSVSEVIFSDNSIWMASNEVWEPLSASRMDILNKNRIAVEQKKAAEWKKAKETKRKIISVISGVILAIIGFIMFIGGFRPNLASDGPTMRVLLIGGWTSLLTARGCSRSAAKNAAASSWESASTFFRASLGRSTLSMGFFTIISCRIA